MRVVVSLGGASRFLVPWNYQHFLHGFVYRAMDETRPRWAHLLHERGFKSEGHAYKMFTFSTLVPRRAKATEEGLLMEPPIRWWISSWFPETLEAVVRFMLVEGVVRLRDLELSVLQVSVEEPPELGTSASFRTMSPVMAATVVDTPSGKGQRFLRPEEPDFWRVIEENLRRKAKALGLRSDGELKLSDLGGWRSKLIWVQGTNVRGFEGSLAMEGDELLIRLAYQVGIGGRNAQGFGMLGLKVSPSRKEKDGVFDLRGEGVES